MKKIRAKSALSRANRLEQRLYEHLGIRGFQRLILRYERFRRRRTGTKNANYHLRRLSLSGLKDLRWYLLYNAGFHLVSLLFMALYALLAAGLTPRAPVLDALAILLTVFNVYCIMLQRYIFLLSRDLILRAEKRWELRIREEAALLGEALSRRPGGELREEYALLTAILGHCQAGRDLFLPESSASLLSRIAQTERCCGLGGPRAVSPLPSARKEPLRALWQSTEALGQVDRRISAFHKLLRLKPRDRLLFRFCLAAADGETERAFRAAFPSLSLEGFEARLNALLLAYGKELADAPDEFGNG